MTDPLSPMASPTESRAFGKSLRQVLARRDQGAFERPERDAVEILASQHPSRLAELIPVRIGRMLQSPFAYYRGTAAVMAYDLGRQPRTGHHITICGDAHISNFGIYASPERRMLFDLNDFDEASVGPWEWDVKRLAASVVLAAREAGATPEQEVDVTRDAITGYRMQFGLMNEMSAVERYYVRAESTDFAANGDWTARKLIDKTFRKASKRTSERLVGKITTIGEDGSRRIVDQPPLMVHVEHATVEALRDAWLHYRATLRPDVSLLLSQYRFVDYVLRVVGVGSVGTRCYVVLFEGPSGAPLFLQVKEAQASVVQTYGRIPLVVPPAVAIASAGNQGYRVVTGQHILQAQSDPFLGWIHASAGEQAERVPTDYYWRQFRDMKGSVELGALTVPQIGEYGWLCGRLLARAHAQSPNPGVISGYLGTSGLFEQQIAAWAVAYADQSERDYEALKAAVASGRLPAERDA